MEGTRNNFVLLLFRQLVEVYRVTGHAHGQLRIFCGRRLCIQQCFVRKHVYVQVIAALFGITVQQTNQIVKLCFADIQIQTLLFL